MLLTIHTYHLSPFNAPPNNAPAGVEPLPDERAGVDVGAAPLAPAVRARGGGGGGGADGAAGGLEGGDLVAAAPALGAVFGLVWFGFVGVGVDGKGVRLLV